MELPSIPEQIVEADRLCTESRRLIAELRELAAGARRRWQTMKLYNEGRWGMRLHLQEKRTRIRRRFKKSA